MHDCRRAVSISLSLDDALMRERDALSGLTGRLAVCSSRLLASCLQDDTLAPLASLGRSTDDARSRGSGSRRRRTDHGSRRTCLVEHVHVVPGCDDRRRRRSCLLRHPLLSCQSLTVLAAATACHGVSFLLSRVLSLLWVSGCLSRSPLLSRGLQESRAELLRLSRCRRGVSLRRWKQDGRR